MLIVWTQWILLLIAENIGYRYTLVTKATNSSGHTRTPTTSAVGRATEVHLHACQLNEIETETLTICGIEDHAGSHNADMSAMRSRCAPRPRPLPVLPRSDDRRGIEFAVAMHVVWIAYPDRCHILPGMRAPPHHRGASASYPLCPQPRGTVSPLRCCPEARSPRDLPLLCENDRSTTLETRFCPPAGDAGTATITCPILPSLWNRIPVSPG